ncbi:DUF6053 domain-containing protein [Lysobacter enzymogenes]|uniref:DUF6053 domain-containing protein n=1 Tax=Lysobacter enzymogenes TaxID=69 RepID=UPI003D18F639
MRAPALPGRGQGLSGPARSARAAAIRHASVGREDSPTTAARLPARRRPRAKEKGRTAAALVSQRRRGPLRPRTRAGTTP